MIFVFLFVIPCHLIDRRVRFRIVTFFPVVMMMVVFSVSNFLGMVHGLSTHRRLQPISWGSVLVTIILVFVAIVFGILCWGGYMRVRNIWKTTDGSHWQGDGWIFGFYTVVRHQRSYLGTLLEHLHIGIGRRWPSGDVYIGNILVGLHRRYHWRRGYYSYVVWWLAGKQFCYLGKIILNSKILYIQQSERVTCSSRYDIRWVSLILSDLSPSLILWASSALSLIISSSDRSAATSFEELLNWITVSFCDNFLRITIWAGSGAAAKSLVRSSLVFVTTIFPLTSINLK